MTGSAAVGVSADGGIVLGPRLGRPSFSDLRHTTYRGRARALIHSTRLASDVRVTARSPRYGESHLDLDVADEAASTTTGGDHGQ